MRKLKIGNLIFLIDVYYIFWDLIKALDVRQNVRYNIGDIRNLIIQFKGF